MMKLIVLIGSLATFFVLENLFPLFQSRKGVLRHGTMNLAIALLNGLLGYFIFSDWIQMEMHWIQKNIYGIFNLFHLEGAVKLILAFIVFDGWMYVWHRLNHEVPFFWKFHQMHHTDTQMDASTALRFHCVEITLSMLLRLGIFFLLGMGWKEFLLYESAILPVIIFHHSNIALPEKWDRILRLLIVTPNMHRVHHSQEKAETNSNYSTFFSFWDRMFGSMRTRPENEIQSIIFGLDYFRQPKWQTIPGMLKTPFVNPQ